MANRDPEPESQHQQFSDEYLEKQKAKAVEDIVTITSTPFVLTGVEVAQVYKEEETKSGKK